jgi:hypothetical protein
MHELIGPWQLPIPAQRLMHTEECVLESDGESAWEHVVDLLSATGHELAATMKGDDVEHAVVRTREPGYWFLGGLYLGLCLLFLTPLVSWRWGWQRSPLRLSLGETRTVEEENVNVTLDQIAYVPPSDGKPGIFDARILVEHGGENEYATVGLDRGARSEGLSFYYLGRGPAVRVSAKDAQGVPLDIQQIPSDMPPRQSVRVRFRQEQQERLLAIPEADLVLTLVSYGAIPSQGIEERALQIQVVRGSTGRVIADRTLTGNGAVGIENTDLDVRFEYYAILGAEHEPERVVVALGGVLTLLGLYGTIIWDPRRMWIAMMEGDGDCHCRLSVLKRHAETPWFQSIKTGLQGGDGDGSA